MTQHDGAMTSAEGEATSEREKRGYDASWADANFTGLKIKKIHAIGSASTNGR
jgi:hypothetical protein